MSFSYGNDPTHTPIDAMRYLIGDTVEAIAGQRVYYLEDEELVYELSQNGPLIAAANACDAIATRLSRETSKSVGPLSISAGEKATAYAARAVALRRRAARSAGGPITVDKSCPTFFSGMLQEPPWRAATATAPEPILS